MSDEPKETQSVNKKVKKPNPKFQVFKYLLVFWGSILLLCLLVYMIPPLRNHVLLKIWSTQNWVEDTWAHKKLREGGPSAVNTLAPYLYEKVGRKRGPYDPRTLVQETMMAMGDEALPAIWNLAATDAELQFIHEDLIYGILKEHEAPGLVASIRSHVTHKDANIRRIAIMLSCHFLEEPKKEWLSDPDPRISSLMLHFFWKDPEAVSYALEKKGKMLEDIFSIAIQSNLELRSRKKSQISIIKEGLAKQEEIDALKVKMEELEKDLKGLNEALAKHPEFRKLEGDALANYIFWLSFQGHEKENIDFIHSCLKNENENVRYRVLRCLTELKTEGLLEELWTVAHSDASLLVKSAAWNYLKSHRTKDMLPRLREEIEKLKIKMKDRYILDREQRVVLKDLMHHLGMLEGLGELEDMGMIRPLVSEYDLKLHNLVLRLIADISKRLNP
jgi:hypothetical protein